MRRIKSTDFGETYAAEYDAAASRDLPYLALLASILFLAFGIVDALTHPGDATTFRLVSSLLPAAALGALAYVARYGLRTRFAPWGVVVGGLLALTSPLSTVVVTRHTIDLGYAMLIIAATGAVLYRQRAFWTYAAIALSTYLTVALTAQVTRDTTGDWIAGGVMAIGLGAALFTARRFSVREMAAANEQLAYLAGHDPLTGLLNRHALETSGPGLIALARRERRDVFAVFVDVDALSTINNEHGHGAGDAVIQAVGAALLATVRAAPNIWRVAVFGSKGMAEARDEDTLAVGMIGGPPPQTRTYEHVDSLKVLAESFADAVEGRAGAAQDQVLLARRQERAVFADIVERLPVGAEALDVGHVGAPHQPPRAELVAQAAGRGEPADRHVAGSWSARVAIDRLVGDDQRIQCTERAGRVIHQKACRARCGQTDGRGRGQVQHLPAYETHQAVTPAAAPCHDVQVGDRFTVQPCMARHIGRERPRCPLRGEIHRRRTIHRQAERSAAEHGQYIGPVRQPVGFDPHW